MASTDLDPNGMPIESVEDFDHYFDCSICYDQLPNDKSVAIACGHVYCAPCLELWTMRAAKTIVNGVTCVGCPECGLPVDPKALSRVVFHAAPLDETVTLQRMARDAAAARRNNSQLRKEINHLRRRIEQFELQRATLESTLDEVERSIKDLRRLDEEMELDDEKAV